MTINFSTDSLLAFCRQRVMVAICAMLACLSSGAVFAAPGQLDTTFGAGTAVTSLAIGEGANAEAMAIDAAGRTVIVSTCGSYSICVTRVTASGAVDTTFAGGTVHVALGAQTSLGYAITTYTDGRILVAGTCNDARTLGCIARLTSIGVLDATFAPTSAVPGLLSLPRTVLAEVRAIKLQSDGKILAAGPCQYGGCVARFGSDGSLDSTFSRRG
jgi:uncharacterized delta-60 repeat protein